MSELFIDVLAGNMFRFFRRFGRSRPEVLAIDASFSRLGDRGLGGELLQKVLAEFDEFDWTLQVFAHTAYEARLPADAKTSLEFIRRIQSERQTTTRRFCVPVPNLKSDSLQETEAFCRFAYWSIGVEVLCEEWPGLFVFDSADNAEYAEYRIPEDLIVRFRRAVGDDMWSRLNSPDPSS